MDRLHGTTLLLSLAVAAATLSLPPYYPYNPHLQNHRRYRYGIQSPRDDYRLRQLFQDAETRCKLRLWRISRRGELDCDTDEQCVRQHGGGVYCRQLQVCKLTKGNVCWPRQPAGGECSKHSDCLSAFCDTDLGLCLQRHDANYNLQSRPSDGSTIGPASATGPRVTHATAEQEQMGVTPTA